MSKIKVMRDNVQAEIVTRDVNALTRQAYNKTTRVYVSLRHVSIDMERPDYGSTRGDGSEGDLAWRKYNRLENEAMRRLIATVMPELDEALTKGADEKLKLSRYAGCTCPCSPGYVAESAWRFEGQPVDVWVSVA